MLGLPPPPDIRNERLGIVPRAIILKPNPFLLKARKNFDLSTDCIRLLSSGVYKNLSGKSIKLLFSKQAKKTPSVRMCWNSKNCAFSKLIARNVKSFSYYIPNQAVGNEKPNTKILKLAAYSYKHLEQLDVKNIDIQNQSSFESISKLNHLKSLDVKLSAGKYLPSPRFFQSLKHLQHLSICIEEGKQITQTDLVALAGFLYRLTFLPSLESYNVEICSASSDQSEGFVGTLLYYLSLLKAKKFSITIRCSEDLDFKVEIFSSLLESIDTLEYTNSVTQSSLEERIEFPTPSAKNFILLLKPSQKNQSLMDLINTCTSLENLYFEQNRTSPLLNGFKLPQTLKTLAIRFSRLESDQTLEFWKNAISSLSSLENLNLVLKSPDVKVQEWVKHLPKNASLKSLKQYYLRLESELSSQMEVEFEYENFLSEWSKSLQSLCALESLGFMTSSIRLKSLDFFTETLASLSKLKSIKLHLRSLDSQPRETLEFAIPSPRLPFLENIWLELSSCVSKDSAVKFLQDIAKCGNLQSLRVLGLSVDEETALPILKGLSSLKKLQFETTAGRLLGSTLKKSC